MVNLRHFQEQSNFSVEAFGWVAVEQCRGFSAAWESENPK